MSEAVSRAPSGCYLGVVNKLRSRWGLSALRGCQFRDRLPWGGGCIVLGVSIVSMGLT